MPPQPIVSSSDFDIVPNRTYAWMVAAASLAAAIGLRMLLSPLLQQTFPLVTLFGAIAISVMVGGYRVGMAVSLIGYLICDLLFMEPGRSLSVGTPIVFSGFMAYLFTAGVVSYIGHSLKTSREECRLREQLLQVTVTSMGDALIATDRSGRVRSLNPAAEKLTGWTQEAAVNQPLESVFHIINEETRVHLQNPAITALMEERVVELSNHALLLARDGREIPIEDSAAPIRFGNAVIGSVLIFRDVSQRRASVRQDRERMQAAMLLASIVASSDDAIVSKTLDGKIQSWNSAAERLFGFSAEEAIGSNITLIIPPERRNEEDHIISKIRAGERVDHYETVRLHKNGSGVEVSLTVSPVRDPDGKIIGASKIARNISERKRLEQALMEANERKDMFLATLAHELRNPLAPIRNWLQIIKQAEGVPPVVEQARASMDRQIGQMVRLIEDLLDIGRITRNKLSLKLECMDLRMAVERAAEGVRPLIDDARQQLELELPDTPVYVEGDLARLTQIVGNLLVNAVKFSDAGTVISASLRVSGDSVSVLVRDSGIGIAGEDLPKLFQMFSQLDTSIDRSRGGLGIGLSLVKQLVDLHGGSVSASSAGRGRGTEFSVTLKTVAAPAISPSAAPVKEAQVGGLKCLVVDDNVDSAESLAMLLKFEGNQVTTAHDGAEALKLAETLRPEVLLLDIGLPSMDGYEVCRAIRSAEWGRDMLIIALTGWGQDKDREKSASAGFNTHLVKPVDYDLLTEALRPALERSSRAIANA